MDFVTRFSLVTPLLVSTCTAGLIIRGRPLYMQQRIITKLGVNVTNKFLSVLKNSAIATVEFGDKILGSLVFHIRRKFTFTSGPSYPPAAIRK
jgi:hypothetical protein